MGKARVNVDKLTDYDVYCGTYENPYQHSHVTYVCSIILNYLKNNNVSDNNTNQFSICKLLNYWAYSTLNDLFPTEGKSKIDYFYKEIEKIWYKRINDSSSVDYYKKCKPDRVLFDYDDWKLRKELYDYYVDILPISKYLKFYTADCEQYYKYIKYKQKIYDQYEKFCENPDDMKCPNFFNECKKYNPKDILPELTCYSKMIEEEKAQQQASQAALASQGHKVPSAQLGDAEIPKPNTSIGAQASNVFLGVVVTSMTSGALYKFTPLGNMLRNRFGWNSNMRNFNGGDNGLFDYASESFNPFSGGAEEHYIGYHPA
ncbi:PIR protein [Plasmodium vivax]|uniref:VIR protein n=1 Tax=Plasmodium vivax TaxID=5855 RepID=A0A564ZQD0_PLAVI|nr:PIR protein [Plasmodium vivax]